MTVRYHQRSKGLFPWYVCQQEGIAHGKSLCQTMPGQDIDATVNKLMVEKLTPTAVTATLAVQQELQQRQEEADALRRQQVERARYEADLARRRYLNVVPENRLVADTLEAEWNEKLRVLRQAEEQYERLKQQAQRQWDEHLQQDLQTLVTDFQRLWNDPQTSSQDRKNIVRLLIEDVTLARSSAGLLVHIRFKGGATQTLEVGRPQTAWQQRQTKPEVVDRIDQLLEHNTDGEVAAHLNNENAKSGMGVRFTAQRIRRLRRDYGLRSRYDRLRGQGYRTLEEIAVDLGVSPQTVKIWRYHGLLRAQRYNDKGEYLYERVGGEKPRKQQGQKLTERPRKVPVESNRSHEVQDET